MPTVTFNTYRDAGDQNYICFSGSCVGPNTGTSFVDKPAGSTNGYSTQGSGPGSVAYRIDSGTRIGLDDRQGEGADGDYNDLIVDITSGNAQFRSGGLYVYYDPPVISGFSAAPNPQTSGTDGVPNYNTTLSWGYQNATSLTLTSSAGESWNVLGTTSRNITNLPQSTGNGASRSYTLTANNPDRPAVSETITVDVYNDRNPSNSWTTSFTGLEPNTQYTRNLGTLSGIDMIIKVESSSSGVFFSNSSSGGFANPKYFTNGQTVYVRTTSLPFNTDTSGLSSSATNGKTNTKTFSVSVGGLSAFNVSYTTRAPVIKENFNYDGEAGTYPYEDIDLISNTPTEYGLTQTLNMDDIEIDMEIKGDKPDLQIKINNGSWKNIRQI
jgi:hypothetical protein